MGKSNKKIKNDRINTIRKQYDAFLEEDKKRRERNEYILGKLDKMRSSTALVPISNKINYNMEPNPSEIFLRQNNLNSKAEIRNNYVSHLERQDLTPGILNKPLEELRILKEISKKYILIPKRTTPIENDYIYRKDVIEDDWKSKYNILDDLKRLDEKGQSDQVSKQCEDNNISNKGLDLNMKSNVLDKESINYSNALNKPMLNKNNGLTPAYESTLFPEKQDIANKQVNFDVPERDGQSNYECKISSEIVSVPPVEGMIVDQKKSLHSANQESIVNSEQEPMREDEKYNCESNEKDLHPIENLINNSEICEMNDINHPAVYEANGDSTEYNVATPEVMKHSVPERGDIILTTSDSDRIISDVKLQEPEPVKHSDENVHLDPNFDNQKETNEIQDLTSSQRVELYDDVDNNPEGLILANESTFDKPQHYDPASNTTPADPENIPHLDHVEHESEINAFEAEQKEMFYSEQTQGETYAYDQADGNAGEYPEGYDQNDQYAYYEGVQQEQAYATNINEHEESTERYDPHYNQQYEGTYENQQPDQQPIGYENNPYEQQQFQDENQPLENMANYENQPENAQYQQEIISNENEIQENILPQDDQTYDQHLYTEQLGTEHIEQQLINEEGYIESSPVMEDQYQKENEGEIEKVMDTMSPETHEQPMLDPKLT